MLINDVMSDITGIINFIIQKLCFWKDYSSSSKFLLLMIIIIIMGMGYYIRKMSNYHAQNIQRRRNRL